MYMYPWIFKNPWRIFLWRNKLDERHTDTHIWVVSNGTRGSLLNLPPGKQPPS